MYIAVEWTSAAFRAFLMEGDSVIGDKKSQRGTTRITPGGFEEALREEIGDWARKAERILFSGMITSRNGWIESPFVHVPAGADQLAAQAVVHHVNDLPPLVFLPGIAQTKPLPDVMRGEEMSLFGLPKAEGLFVLPGPHAKWVRTEGGRITTITTYMSGEILNLLKKDSLVSRLIPAVYEERPEAFHRGVQTVFRDDLPGRILARIFSARSLVLFDELPAAEIADYLSGLIIGAEVLETVGTVPAPDITIVGMTPLAERYRIALELMGVSATIAPADPARGFARIAASFASAFVK